MSQSGCFCTQQQVIASPGSLASERKRWADLGLSSALHEATELDLATARYVNQDLSEYHLPVCADIGESETIMLDEVDTLVNPLGSKGVGELGVTGVNAAIANAVFQATGVRLRKLPIRAGDTLPVVESIPVRRCG